MTKTPNVSHDDHRPNVALYVKIFAALMVLTMVTVIISKFHLPKAQAIGLGLFVAAVKASLVAGVFMHLKGENKLIHNTLWITVGCAAILVLPLIDFAMVAEKLLDRTDVAAQHPGGHHAEDGAAPAPGRH